MVTNKVGPPVRGEDFYDRKEILAALWNKLNDGNNLLLLAPRRVGKTSLMARLCEEASSRHYWPVFFSVEGATTESDFIKRFHDAVSKLRVSQGWWAQLAGSPIGRFLKRVKKAGPIEWEKPGDASWADYGEALADALSRLQSRALVLIDELPVFILELIRQDSTATRARHFLHWFRDLRVGPQAGKTIRWFLAGSIGLDAVANRVQLGQTINDLHPITDFGPFSEAVADAFLAELANTYQMQLSVEVRRRLCERIGWLIPYHLQLLFAELRTHCETQGAAPGPEALDAAYQALFSAGKRNAFVFWEQRLTQELGPPDNLRAVALLNAAAKDPRGVTKTTFRHVLTKHVADPSERDQHLDYLLKVLKGDGYLVPEGKRYRFRSPLLRDFWLRRLRDD